MPEINLYDLADVARALGKKPPDEMSDGLEFDAVIDKAVRRPAFRVQSADSDRDEILQEMLDDPRGPARRLAVADHETLRGIDAVMRDAPNLAEALGLVRRAAMLSWATGAPLVVPPILLLGPPGVGKTYAARRVAKALRVPFAEISLATSDDTAAICGHSLSWRGARLGLLARTLLDDPGRCASPVMLVDEVDKVSPWHSREQPLAIFHALLEPENSQRFKDEFLEVPVRADFVTWLLTANDVSDISPSLIDRLTVVTVAAPTSEQQMGIAAAIYRSLIDGQLDAFEPILADAVLDAVGDVPPRQVRRVLMLALGFAAGAGRRRLTADDVRAAAKFGSHAARTRIGFHGGS